MDEDEPSTSKCEENNEDNCKSDCTCSQSTCGPVSFPYDDSVNGIATFYVFNFPSGTTKTQLEDLFPGAVRISFIAHDSAFIQYTSGVKAAHVIRESIGQKMSIYGRRLLFSTTRVNSGFYTELMKKEAQSKAGLKSSCKYGEKKKKIVKMSLTKDVDPEIVCIEPRIKLIYRPAYLYIMNLPMVAIAEELAALFPGAVQIQIKGNIGRVEFENGVDAARALLKPYPKILTKERLVISLVRPKCSGRWAVRKQDQNLCFC